jgi:glycosyltransferase involved in cell wall biosynthesis
MLVSVLLPVYNSESTIESCLDSILSQTYDKFELLAFDDGSTDSSLHILKKYADLDARVKVFSRENKGLAYTLNELIQLSSGNYLARMDSDDICLPDRFLSQVDYLNNNPGCVMVGGQVDFLIGERSCETFLMPLDHESILSGLLECRFPICHPALMFRKDIAQKVGGYSCDMPGEDLDFFLRMSEFGLIENMDKKVLNYRMGLTSLSVSKSNELGKAYSLARTNYHLRMNEIKEISIEQYQAIWPKLFGERYYFFLRNISENIYRKSIYYKCNKNRIRYFFVMSIACMCRPRVTIKRALNILNIRY